jgi:hypothetical protein
MNTNKTRPMPVLSIEWKQMSDDGLGGIELILETDYEGFRFFENAINGVHRTAISNRGVDDLVISQGVRLRVINKRSKA